MGTEPHDRDEPQRDDWDDLVLDENFVRGAEVNEPTARTRMLTERWKNEAPAPQPWRSDEPPAGWIHSTSPKQEKREKREKRKRGGGKLRGIFRRRKDDGTDETR
ncbi:SGM_3592 family protein [Streptomyces lonarensis]|uniref:SGM_3592 family protein n=1 Tax=Streptomyces lonarensis TaxID=700599 RepID=UPI001FD8171A|nr:hypothetical protein [Streptomyces lonarensis]